MSYAPGKYAYGICDKTGFRYPLKDLVYEYKDGQRTGMRVGKDVVDPDHPQNFLGRVRVVDPQALRDPRPDRVEPYVVYVGVPNVYNLEPTQIVGLGTINSVFVTSNVDVSVSGVSASGIVGALPSTGVVVSGVFQGALGLVLSVCCHL